jgi:hypothetical protein
LFVDRGSQGVQADGASAVVLEDGEHELAVSFVETVAVYFEEIEGLLRYADIHEAGCTDLGIIPDPAQQAIRDARRSTGPATDFLGSFGIDLYFEQRGRAGDDLGHVVYVVVIEPQNESESGRAWVR